MRMRMRMKTVLPLLACLASASVTPLTGGAPLKVLSSPSLLRVDTPQNVFVECQGCTGGDLSVRIAALSYPTKTVELHSAVVTLSQANRFQAFGKVEIPATSFGRDAGVKQWVYLQAHFDDEVLERLVLVSFQSGHVFIQTDKTLYTPSSRVHYRVLAVTPQTEPLEGRTIVTELQTPDGLVLPINIVSLTSGITSDHFQLPEMASPGLWTLVAKFQSIPQQSYSAGFEVKEYVLPTSEVTLRPLASFFHVDDEELTVEIGATYLFGEQLDGMAYVAFGVMQGGRRTSLPGSLQRVPVRAGRGSATLRKKHLTQTFPNMLELVGSSIFVSVSVLTETGSEMVEAHVGGVRIVTSPYTINFKKTPTYFKPGMPFDVTVEVLYPDQTPAAGVQVLLNPGEIRGVAGRNGVVRLTVNTPKDTPSLLIAARTDQGNLASARQAHATMTAHAHATNSDKYIHIEVNSAVVELGDNLRVHVTFNHVPEGLRDITYLVQARGQLIQFGRHQTQGVLTVMNLHVTKEMLPSFRIVAYYHPSDSEVASDSVWVELADSCMGTLKLDTVRAAMSYLPRSVFSLRVTGDPGATVGLVAVDKGVSVLNNKHRLTQKKVRDKVEEHDSGCTPGGGRDSMGVFYDAGLMFQTSTASGTPIRQELKCAAPQTARWKRASTTMEASTTSGDDDRRYEDGSLIVSRSLFTESWLWTDLHLPACPAGSPACETTSVEKAVPLPDLITTWQVIGVSLSQSHGLCVGEPLEVVVRKQFFIDLRLPHAAVHMEQLEIKAVLHNNSPQLLTVQVELAEDEHVCSTAFKQGRYRQEVTITAQSTRSVSFVIIPMKVGEVTIEVKAAVMGEPVTDGIIKNLRVLPAGVLVKRVQVLALDPAAHGGTQEETLNSRIPRNQLVPHSPSSTYISVSGSQVVLENAVNGKSMGTLIYQPLGCGEQNMFHMTRPVIAALYLDRTNQWEAVGFQRRDEALRHIQAGVRQQLVYRKLDGSFARWANQPSSSWLTAFVAKVFAMAHGLVAVPSELICDAIKYLYVHAQLPDGEFREVGPVFFRETMGDVRGTDSDASMTAFKLIAMQESRHICAAALNSLLVSINKAVTYLESRLPSLTNPYAVAMTSYALANEGKFNREILYKFVSPELSHWPVPKGRDYTLEATAYALLALVRAQEFEEARPVVRWLGQQQLVGQGLQSTQATVMVHQAVSQYWINAQEHNLDLDILLQDRLPVKFFLNRDNGYLTRAVKLNSINQDVKVTAKGSGEATVKMVSAYYALPAAPERDCQMFNMSVELLPVKTDEDEKIYTLKIELLYNSEERDSTMAVLDIGLLTGTTVDETDLALLSGGGAPSIAKYEMNTMLGRGSLIIYLNKVSHTRPEEIRFRIMQTLRVSVQQPAAVSVYEYNNQRSCVKFYHPQRPAGQLLQLCQDDKCICAEEKCSMQKMGKTSNNERTAKICEDTPTSKIDFAYKVKLEEVVSEVVTDRYNMVILDVIKEGLVDIGPVGKRRTFLGYQYCRDALALQKEKTYLVMGSSSDIHRGDNQTFQYLFGDTTWVEYWPSAAECQEDEHQASCMGLDHTVNVYTLFGCMAK